MADTATTLAVKDFRKFQHYRDRSPTWIKLYNALLDDYAFSQLPEVTRAHLMLIWLLASRHDNRIPNDPKYIARAIHAKAKVDLAGMIAGGWLLVEQSASGVLAEAEQDATAPRTREEGETERETKTSSADLDIPPVHLGKTAGERSLALRLDTNADRIALTAICARVPNATSWVAEGMAALDGMHGPALTPRQLGEALRDYVANGALNQPNFRHFRRYLTNAGQPYTKPRSNGHGKSNPGAQQVENIRQIFEP